MFPLWDKIKYTLIHKVRLKEKRLISIKICKMYNVTKPTTILMQNNSSQLEEHYWLNKATYWNTREDFAIKTSHFDLS